MANIGALKKLGDRAIDETKSIFSSIRDAFGRESMDLAGDLKSEVRSFPSVPEPTVDNAPLMAVHNTSPEGILAANEIGGIPSPSIGISDPANLQKFGEISLIMSPKKLDPSMNIYPTDAYTGRQPKGEVKIVNPKQFKERLKADVNLGHMADYAAMYLNKGNPEEADYTLKVVNAAIDNNLVEPKDFNNIEELFEESKRKLSTDQNNMNFLNQYDGLKEYADVRRLLPPKDLYYDDGSPRPYGPYTARTVLKAMRQGDYGPMYMPASEEYAQNYAGAFRAATSRPFKSIDEVKDARGQIYVEERDKPSQIQASSLSNEPAGTGDILNDLFNNFSELKYALMDDLTRKFEKKEIRTRRYRKDGEFVTTEEPVRHIMSMDTASELLLALGRNDADISRTAAVSEGFVSMDDIPALRDAVNRVGEIMQNAPTKYFEAKPDATISLSDFDTALVPEYITGDKELMRIFKENNLPVSTYTDFGANKDRYREGVMRQMKENLFSVPVAGMLGYGALQSVGEDNGESGS